MRRRLIKPPRHRAEERFEIFPPTMSSFPRLVRVRQNFPHPPPLDLEAALTREFEKLRPHLKRGARIAVGVGSRGITNLRPIIASVIAQLRAAGTQPFIIPAMG